MTINNLIISVAEGQTIELYDDIQKETIKINKLESNYRASKTLLKISMSHLVEVAVFEQSSIKYLNNRQIADISSADNTISCKLVY